MTYDLSKTNPTLIRTSTNETCATSEWMVEVTLENARILNVSCMNENAFIIKKTLNGQAGGDFDFVLKRWQSPR